MIIDAKKYIGECSCGRSHEMYTQYAVIGAGCLRSLGQYLEESSLTGFSVAVYDTNTYQATADRHPAAGMEIILPAENLHANEKGVEQLLSRLPEKLDFLIAIGSGTIHDITRYCAYVKGVPFVSCPTAASVDGFCSSVAAMTWNGCKKTLTAVAPKIVVADIDIIKNAPAYLAKSGFGDMVGKYIALTDWKIANILTGEYYCDRIARMTMDATKAVMESAGKIGEKEDSAYENLIYGLLLSGLAMQMVGYSRPASGAEHHISHFIEMKPEGLGIASDALHGEKVGVGTLLAAQEYHRLASLPDIRFRDYEKPEEQEIRAVFGDGLFDGVQEENRKDAACGITAEMLRENWPEICGEIKKLPAVDTLRQIYADLGVKRELSDIQVPDALCEQILKYSPCVRNRLTLMRLRGCANGFPRGEAVSAARR